MPEIVDTIVAPITAAGQGERAAVRLSGPRARAIVQRVLTCAGLPEPGRRADASWQLEPGAAIPLWVLAWRAPRSLTGEDVVEIHLRGWAPLVTELVRRLVSAGARPAERGEFTRRALALGRIDLVQALAVGRLAAARDVEQAQAAAGDLVAGLETRHAHLRDAILDALALIEAHVDFEEEDTEAVTRSALRRALERARDAARTLLAACGAVAPTDGETDVALLGPPNAGKSQLFLALCPGARTTVSPVAGTTRDMLEARVESGGRRYRVLDGPGVGDPVGDGPRPDDEGASTLDRRAADAFAASVPRHAVVLLVEDVTAPLTAEQRARLVACVPGRPLLAVRNKCDLLADGTAGEAARNRTDGRTPAVSALPGDLAVSALAGEGLDPLWAAVAAAAPVPRAPDLATESEREAVGQAVERLSEALDPGGDPDAALPVVAVSLRDALALLDDSRAVAPDVHDEILERIFATFCVGK